MATDLGSTVVFEYKSLRIRVLTALGMRGWGACGCGLSVKGL